MRNRFAILLFVMLALSGLNLEPSAARTASPLSVQLLSYSELMALSRERRIQYLEGVQAILVDLAKNPDGRISDRDPTARSKLKAWLDWVNDEIKSASATETSRCSENKACETKMLECFARNIGVKWTKSSGYQCDDRRQIELPSGMANAGIAGSNRRVLEALKKSVLDPRTEQGSAENIQLTLQTTDSRPPAAANTGQGVTDFDTSEARASSEAIAAKLLHGAHQPDPTLEASQPPAIPIRAPQRPSSSDQTNPASAERPQISPETVSETTSGAAEALSSESAAEPTTAPASAPVRLISPPRSRAKSASAVPTRKALSSKFACAPKSDVCEDPKNSRAKVFQGNLACVFAGMVSHLDSKNRKCEAITEFKLGETSYKCASGQTMCNPLLFGTVSATKPICVGRGHNVTAQCGKLSSAHDAEVFLNRNESGLQNKWDEFRAEFEKICQGGTIQAKFHCVECNVMRSRIFELQARLVGDPCKGAATFENAIKDRIKSRGSPTSK